jgi:hypothetical protein
MAASDYVNTYLELWCWVQDRFTVARVRNYLQSGLGSQATRASAAYWQLLRGVTKLAGNRLPAVFEVQGEKFNTASIWRVFNGKGAPDEIQDAIWLASLCDLVTETTLATYCDLNLGIDSGGFVANYWGIGHPTFTDLNPNGATGFRPRTIWSMYPSLRRKSAEEIQAGDAAIFFRDVKSDDPDIAANTDHDGNLDSTSGSQAFHIAVVSAIASSSSSDMLSLEISESSGAPAASGGNGVNVRSLGEIAAKVSNHLVYCEEGANRIYFIGRPSVSPPYLPNTYTN